MTEIVDKIKETAEKVGQKSGILASEASDKINAFASKLRKENKGTCDSLDTLCGGMAAFLAIAWASVLESMASAFFPYLFVTFALNIPPFAYGLASVFSAECNSRWLLNNSFLSAVHMVVSVYIVVRIREEETPTNGASLAENDRVDANNENGVTPYVQAPTEMSTGLETSLMYPPNSWERIGEVVCRDLTMAFYYILCLVWLIWQVIGTSRLIHGDVAKACSNWLSISVICGRLYIFLGLAAWTFSLCLVRYNKLKDEENPNSQEVLTIEDNGGVSLA